MIWNHFTCNIALQYELGNVASKPENPVLLYILKSKSLLPNLLYLTSTFLYRFGMDFKVGDSAVLSVETVKDGCCCLVALSKM